MKGLRIICVFALVALLVLVSVGTVFAKGGPPADVPKGPKFEGEKQGFTGNVTAVADGNVTIALADGGTVTLLEGDGFQYKIPREINKWKEGNITALISDLNGSLVTRRLVVQAGNVTGEWIVLKLMVLPVPGSQPLHAHRTGNVTLAPPADGTSGNITIKDVHGVLHTFAVIGNETAAENQTIYRPMGVEAGNITVGSFVTVVTTGNQKSVDLPNLPVAKAIVLHVNMPED